MAAGTLPIVAIVGRANVGKSTLFNRLSVNVKSITFNTAGVTRDSIQDTISWQDKDFILVDTGGISIRKSEDSIVEEARLRALAMIQRADLVLFVTDGVVGVTQQDQELAGVIHKIASQVVLVINKADVKKTHEQQYEFDRLGFKDSVLISAQHGTGIADLLEFIVQKLPVKGKYKEEEPAYKVALIGRPNVGKSSLLNLLIKKERAIVADQPGTTRESISELVHFYKAPIQITDTPGIRKKRAVEEPLEELMVKRAMASLKDAHIVLLLVDITQGRLTDQELKLAFYAFEEHYKAVIILFNKTDLADVDTQELLKLHEYRYKHFLKKIKCLEISCETGHNIGKIFPLIEHVYTHYTQQFSSQELTILFQTALTQRPLYRHGHVLRLYKAEQVGVAPITIVLDVDYKDLYGSSERAYFENSMRKHFDLQSVPIKFILRSKKLYFKK